MCMTTSYIHVIVYITGIVLRCFMSQFGFRISVMLGGVISSIGLGLGMFVTDLYQVYLTFGVITGTYNRIIVIQIKCKKNMKHRQTLHCTI